MRYVLAIAMVLVTGCSKGTTSSTTNSSYPNDGHYRAKSISSSGAHTCAVGVGGASCWGHNGGAFGNGHSGGSTLAPTKIGFGASVSSLEAKVQRKMGRANAKVQAMAADDVQISTTDGHTCGIDGGAAYCWGSNTFGQNGDQNAPNDSIDPVAVVNMTSSMTGIVTAPTFACGIKNGAAYCWGANNNNQLGADKTDVAVGVFHASPVAVTNLSAGVIQIGVDSQYDACALKDDGTIACWGAVGSVGLLGNAAQAADTFTPVPVDNITSATSISVGADSACAIVDDTVSVPNQTNVYCWGDNEQGQLGNGTHNATANPTPVKVLGLPSTFHSITQISVGFQYACAIADGGVYCWGANYNGNLGIGGNADGGLCSAGVGCPIQTSAVQIPGLAAVRQVTTDKLASSAHSCTVLADYSVMCWGANGQGQLGDGTIIERDEPTYVKDSLTTVGVSLDSANGVAPVVLVSGVYSGNTVQIFSDAACSNQVASTTAANDGTVGVTLGSLSSGNYTFYANQKDPNGNVSLCSASGVNYLFKGVLDTWNSSTITLALIGGAFDGSPHSATATVGGAICTCQVSITGNDDSGSYTMASCSYTSGGSGDPGCAGLNNTGVYNNDGITFNMSGLDTFQ